MRYGACAGPPYSDERGESMERLTARTVEVDGKTFGVVQADTAVATAEIQVLFETDEDTGVTELRVYVNEVNMPNVRIYAGSAGDPLAVRRNGVWL